ncbi:MAG: winged helix-turn-helix domain-containing protein [Candidatus Thermoplasmatota archaeon]
MKNIIDDFGKSAGKIWQTLNENGPLTESKLLKMTRLSEEKFYAAVGWLARENKICKNGSRYQLGDTNLTPKIGTDAGKVWTTLSTNTNIDVSSIADLAEIDERDAYSALGWLAREDKIQVTKVGSKNWLHKFAIK